MTCPACQSPLKLTADVRIYHCEGCGREYTPVAAASVNIMRVNTPSAPPYRGDNFEFVENANPPRTVDDLRRLK